MADRPLLSAIPGWMALGLVLPALGSGPQNGDVVAYAAQAQAGLLSDRWTHAGYLLLAWLLSLGAGEALLTALDLLSWGAAALAVGAAAWRAGARGGNGGLAGLGAAAVVLPWAALAEVDLPWVAAAMLALGGSLAWAAVAIAISPVALLALPAIGALAEGRGCRLAAWALGTVALLTLLSRGDWWVGERGVLAGEALLPGRTLQSALLHLPWALLLLLPRSGWSKLAWFAPLLLAPPDVPVWTLVGVVAAVEVACQPKSARWLPLAVAVQLLLGLGEAAVRIARVQSERELTERAASLLGPGDGLCAPFAWGARVAGARTGDPYGIPWHPPGRFLRDQRRQWCEAGIVRVMVLPPVQEGELIWRGLEPMERCP